MDLAALAERPQITRVTIESIYGKVMIEVPEVDLVFSDFFEYLIEPAMLAHGYAAQTINRYLERPNSTR